MTNFKVYVVLFIMVLGISACSPSASVTTRSQQPKWTPPPGTIEAPLTLRLTTGKFSGSAEEIVVQGSISRTTTRPYALGSDFALSLSEGRIYQDLNPNAPTEEVPIEE